MTIRRLLAVASGGGSFAAAPEQEVLTLTSKPQAGWPRGNALRNGDYAYVPFVNDAGGKRVVVRNLATGETTTRVLVADGGTVDHHDSPVVCVRDDGRLLTAWCDHNGTELYIRASANTLDADPTISGGWGTQYEVSGDLSTPSFTYPWLANCGGTIVLTWRSISGSTERYGLAFSSDADSNVWSTEIVMFSGPNVAARFCKTSDDRIEIAASPGGSNSSSYHMYYVLSDDEFYKTDGTLITDPWPIAFSNMTRIYNGSVEGMESSVIDVKSLGGEIAVILSLDDGSDNEHWRAKWDGSWNLATIATGVGPNTTYYETGFAAVDPLDFDRVIVSRRPTPDLDEERVLYEYTTDDSFATSTITTINDSRPDGNIYPVFLDGYDARLEYVWLDGETGIGEDFEWGIKGWGG